MKRYSGDPYSMTAKYDGPCAKSGCTRGVKRGDRIFYYPRTRSAYCAEHEERERLAFLSAACDEEGYGFAS